MTTRRTIRPVQGRYFCSEQHTTDLYYTLWIFWEKEIFCIGGLLRFVDCFARVRSGMRAAGNVCSRARLCVEYHLLTLLMLIKYITLQ